VTRDRGELIRRKRVGGEIFKKSIYDLNPQLIALWGKMGLHSVMGSQRTHKKKLSRGMVRVSVSQGFSARDLKKSPAVAEGCELQEKNNMVPLGPR